MTRGVPGGRGGIQLGPIHVHVTPILYSETLLKTRGYMLTKLRKFIIKLLCPHEDITSLPVYDTAYCKMCAKRWTSKELLERFFNKY